MDEKDEISIKEAAEAVIEAMDFKGPVIVNKYDELLILQMLNSLF